MSVFDLLVGCAWLALAAYYLVRGDRLATEAQAANRPGRFQALMRNRSTYFVLAAAFTGLGIARLLSA